MVHFFLILLKTVKNTLIPNAMLEMKLDCFKELKRLYHLKIHFYQPVSIRQPLIICP
jgi:hypothetical protein